MYRTMFLLAFHGSPSSDSTKMAAKTSDSLVPPMYRSLNQNLVDGA